MEDRTRYASRAAAEDLAGDLRALMDNLAKGAEVLAYAESDAAHRGRDKNVAPLRARYHEDYQETLRRLLGHCGVPDDIANDIMEGNNNA